jgi:hypothetical protein
MMVWLRRLALSASLILISACTGSQSTIGGAGMTPQAFIPTQGAHFGSWILPEEKAQDLIYFSIDYLSGGGSTYILSLPQGKLVGRFKAAGRLCSDNSGNVWIAGYPNGQGKELAEYAHGGVKPVKILHDSNMSPGACAVDPTSGNLATTGEGHEVDVYTSGSSYPQRFVYKKFYPSALTYDGSGNLFILGNRHNHNGTLGTAELPKGMARFQPRRINVPLSATSGFRWDGKYLTIGDSLFEGGHELFRYAARGNRLQGHGYTSIGGNFQYMAHYWIQGSKAVATTYCGSYNSCAPIYLFDYPAGGNPINTIGQGVVPSSAGHVTISVARK